ncbi:elongation factor Ts [Candidatus Uhrbacteria bacterium]|nr:elongation factor Ts [Candidatus Uhrbacteria bacterium]
MIETSQVTKLRTLTGSGIVDCKKALEESNGNFDAAVDYLRKRGQKIAANKEGRATHEGIVYAYVHTNGRVGTIVEISCETDFVARNEQFKQFAHEIALQITATNPLYIRPEDVPQEVIEKEKEIYLEQLPADKPEQIREKILAGKLDKYFQEVCLLKQQSIKDEDSTIEHLLTDVIAKMGENIQVKRFCRFSL